MTAALNHHLAGAAHTLVAVARLNDALSRPESCEACHEANGNGPTRIIWHHHDYAKPLDLIALCRPCHGKVHAGSIQEPRTGRVYPKRDPGRVREGPPTITLKLDDDLKGKAEAMAKADDRSVSALIRVLLAQEHDRRTSA